MSYLTEVFPPASVVVNRLPVTRINLENPWVWILTVAGVFAVAVRAALGFFKRPSRNDLIMYAVTMALMSLVGVVGFVLHVNTNLVANGSILIERFVRGSPLLAPLVFANWGLIGMVALLDPREEREG